MLALMHLSGSGKNVSARAKHSRDIFPNDFDAISLFPQLHQMSASSWKKKRDGVSRITKWSFCSAKLTQLSNAGACANIAMTRWHAFKLSEPSCLPQVTNKHTG